MDRRFRKKMERYWNKRWKNSLLEVQSLDFESWFDFWHIHPDWDFKGNRDSEMRKWVANITYDLLREIERLISSHKARLQVWATICEDSGNNAVFIHSENPNGTPFPYDFSTAEWGIDATNEMKGIIDFSTHELGKTFIKNETVYFIRRK